MSKKTAKLEFEGEWLYLFQGPSRGICWQVLDCRHLCNALLAHGALAQALLHVLAIWHALMRRSRTPQRTVVLPSAWVVDFHCSTCEPIPCAGARSFALLLPGECTSADRQNPNHAISEPHLKRRTHVFDKHSSKPGRIWHCPFDVQPSWP